MLPEVDAFMGIDQVAAVGEIVERAIESRTLKAAVPVKAMPRAKAVKKAVAQLDASAPSAEDPAQSLKGTDRHNHTRTVVSPVAGPVVEVAEIGRAHV